MKHAGLELPAKVPQDINSKMRGAHIGLRTMDFEGTIHWYTEKLGFRILKKWTVGELQLAFLAPANDDNFWIEVLSGGIPDAQLTPSHLIGSGFQHPCLEVDDVDETLAAL
jgi:lactoylglutathione lyase